MDNYNYTLIILATAVGFFLLAAILLVPIYLFLNREEESSKRWTKAEVEKRLYGQAQDEGAAPDPEGAAPGS